MITLGQFERAHAGKYLDFDHVYGAQCVDLVLYYLREVWGLPPLPGNAIDEFGENAARIVWTRNNPRDLGQLPPVGGIIIWGRNVKVGTGVFGHTAIVLNAYRDHFISLDQNWPVGSFVHRVRHTYDGIVGWGALRPATPVPAPKPPLVVPLPPAGVPIPLPAPVPTVPPVAPPIVIPEAPGPLPEPPPPWHPAPTVPSGPPRWLAWLLRLFGL